MVVYVGMVEVVTCVCGEGRRGENYKRCGNSCS